MDDHKLLIAEAKFVELPDRYVNVWLIESIEKKYEGDGYEYHEYQYIVNLKNGDPIIVSQRRHESYYDSLTKFLTKNAA